MIALRHVYQNVLLTNGTGSNCKNKKSHSINTNQMTTSITVQNCRDVKCPMKSSYYDAVNCVGRCPERCKTRTDFGQCVQDCACECVTGTFYNSPFFIDAANVNPSECPKTCKNLCSGVLDIRDCFYPCVATCPRSSFKHACKYPRYIIT